jgi:hypothetical protein
VWLDLLAADHDNFVAGLEWSLSAGAAGADTAAESALALAAALAPFWKIRGYIGLGQRWLDAALAAAGPRADPRLRAAALDGGGMLAAVRADYDAQRAYQHQSLAIWLAEAVGEPRSIAESLEELAEAESARGNMRRSAGLIGAAQTIREEIGAPVPGPDLVRYNQALAAAELALGPESFAAAVAAGRALSMAGAVRFAMDDAPTPMPHESEPVPAHADQGTQ